MLNVLHPTLGAKRQTFVLDACPSVNDAVTKQLQKRSIAVLVNINNNPGKYQCTLAQIVEAYGRPNASATLTGSLTAPKQVLLFYDNGPLLSGPLKPVSPPQAPATVVPATLSALSAPTCANKTFLSFVAHEDDDLLFMSPDHLHALHGGDCLRTVYLTAGDDGLRSTYWLGREKGAEAAYDSMVGHGPSLWLERYILVSGHEYIKMASPRGNPSITLIFVHLPDGNVPGTGFLRTHYQSLAKLANGGIGDMSTVDGQSHYSKSDLTNLLVRLMQFYHPDEIDTQTPLNASTTAQEHSDHMTTGQFAAAAYTLYAQKASLKYYTGYPIALLPQNVSGQDLTDKTAAFYAYASHDPQACLNPADCAASGPYATWNMRQYTYMPGDPLITPSPVPLPATTDPTTPPTN
jgi:LmbE family N-acetylglucosaminyl deacetylase